MTKPVTYTLPEWSEEGARLFGNDQLQWKFVCPACGTVASISEYQGVKAPQLLIGRACIGYFIPGVRALGDKATGPCCYVADRDAPVRILDDGESDAAFNFSNAATLDLL